MQKIATALVKAQKQFGPALKTATNPHFRSRYADLSACVEAVIDALNENGIFLTQHVSDHERGVVVETVFLHESGERLDCGKLFVPASKQDAQGFGSAETYARRYSLMAACGIAPEDDDGNAAAKSKPQAAVRHKPTDGAVVDQHRLSIVADTADAAKERFASNDMLGAFELCQGITDAEEKTALWAMLPSNLRSALKKHADSIREQA
jgi:hypothetical protein